MGLVVVLFVELVLFEFELVLVLFDEFDALAVLEAFAWPLVDDPSAGELELGGDGRGGGGGAPAYRAASANIAKSKMGGTPWALCVSKKPSVSYVSLCLLLVFPLFLEGKKKARTKEKKRKEKKKT